MRDTNQAISGERKQQIAEDLRNYVEHIAGGSANKASKMLKGVSNAYISNMLAGKWESISDDAWRNVSKQVRTLASDWQIVETKPGKALHMLFEDAQLHANTFGIIAEAGTGKSRAAESYRLNRNVFLVSCNEFFNRKAFLSELLRVMGVNSGGYTVTEMMGLVIATVQKADSPLIILDEADKLSDQVLYFFISLYNSLEGKCGIVLMATDFLEKRVMKGLRLNRKGYKEIYSRLGRKFINIPRPSLADIKGLIRANGVTEEIEINRICNEAEGDLRRVKRLVHAAKRKEGNDG